MYQYDIMYKSCLLILTGLPFLKICGVDCCCIIIEITKSEALFFFLINADLSEMKLFITCKI